NSNHLSDNAAAHQCGDVKVEQQSDSFIPHLQIAQQLRFMNKQHMFNAFEFKDDQIIHNQIDTITAVQVNAFVCDRKRHLPPELNPTEVQFVTQAFFVSRFLKPPGQARDVP